MITLPKDLDQHVQEIEKEFPGEVLLIRYTVDEDWTGDPAVHFRIVLEDDATLGEKLFETVRRVERKIEERVNFRESDYRPYFAFRSKSEYEALKDPQWQ